MTILYFCLTILIGYFIGSIPWALVIGKVFYKTDVRQHGSGNLGGTNVLRTLGVVPGVSVMVLDALKAFIYMIILYFLGLEKYMPVAGLGVCLGHCFPIFVHFKGGKAVACCVGYVLAMASLVEHQFLFCWLTPMLVFVSVLALTKYMSLASITLQVMFILTALKFYSNTLNIVLITCLGIFVIWMHRANIKRLINGNENKLGSKKK